MGEAESSCGCHGGGGPRRRRGGGDRSAWPCQRERAKEEDGKPFAAESQPSAVDDASEDSPSASAPMAGLGERRGGGGGIMVGEAWVPRVRRQDEDVDEAPHGGRLRWRERGKRRPASRLPPSRSRTWARTQRRTPPTTTRPTAPRTRRLGRSQGGWPTRARTAWRPLPSASAPVAWGPWWTPWRRRRHCGRPPKRLLWKGPSMAETHGGGRRITRGIDGKGEGRHQKSRRRRVDNPAGPCDRVIDKLREGEVVVWRRGWLVGGETVVARVAEVGVGAAPGGTNSGSR
uniref:Uncharacterized protein n=1 Tax=Oryza barthii TaxID=65489 RepID=A0A0D3ERE2_9ORYZ